MSTRTLFNSVSKKIITGILLINDDLLRMKDIFIGQWMVEVIIIQFLFIRMRGREIIVDYF